MKEESNVLSFTPDYSLEYCSHTDVRIDGSGRRVWCGKCEAQLDALDILARYAREQTSELDRLHAERDDTWDKICDLVKAGGRLTIGKKGVKVFQDGISRSGSPYFGQSGSLAESVLRALDQLASSIRFRKRSGSVD